MSVFNLIGVIGGGLAGAGIALLLRASVGAHQPTPGRRLRERVQWAALIVIGLLIATLGSALAR